MKFLLLLVLLPVLAQATNFYSTSLTCYPNFAGFGPGGPILFPNQSMIKINPCYPCWEPPDAPDEAFPEKFRSWSKWPEVQPSGQINVIEFDESNPNQKLMADITLSGFADDMHPTVWGSYWFPFIANSPHPVFGIGSDESAFVDADAAVSFPFVPIKQAFTDGVDDSNEANAFNRRANGDYTTRINFDYRFNHPDQGPMRNGRSAITQVGMNHSEYEQYLGRLNRPTAIGSAFLRHFNNYSGYQENDENGDAVVAKSPLPVAFLAIIGHLDGMTHGINPGTAVSRAPGSRWYHADHFLLGIFDLRGLWEDPPMPEFESCSGKKRGINRLDAAKLASGAL